MCSLTLFYTQFPSLSPLFHETAKSWHRLHWEIRQLELPLITRQQRQKFDSQWFGILHFHHYCNETLNIYHIRVRGESFCPVSLRFWLIIMAHWVQHLLQCVTIPLSIIHYVIISTLPSLHHSVCSWKHHNHLKMLIW